MNIITKNDLLKINHKFQVYFAVFCAEQVTSYLDDKTKEPALKAIEITKLWLENKASKEEVNAAAHAAHTAAAHAAAYAAAYAANAAHTAAHAAAYAADAATYTDAAGAAAGAAAYAAHTAADAADAATYTDAAAAHAAAYAADAAAIDNATKDKVIKAQWDYYYELLNFDKNFEKIILKRDI